MARHSPSGYITPDYDQIVSNEPTRRDMLNSFDGRASTETYCSSVESFEEDGSNDSRVEVVHERYGHPPDVVASNPPTFGRLFPSTRRLLIQHDDTTTDGNMNLRVDTMITEARRRQREMVLFHLRMYDLRDRKFSLRRYCRDSGREVCHSSIKFHQSTTRRRPLSTAFSALRTPSDADSTTANSLKRLDSDFKSWAESESPYRDQSRQFDDPSPDDRSPVPTNTIQLDFSNYARVDVKRQGSRGFRHYDFEYWKTKYQWRKSIEKYGSSKEISYHLYHSGRSKPIAYITPERLTPLEAMEEERKGGWIPMSSMWINDPTVYEKMSDVAE